MRVSELARRAGVAASAVRFYEANGVLPIAPRSESGYREYDERDLNRLRVLVTLRSLGLHLHQAGRLAMMCSEGRCDEMALDLMPQIAARRDEIAGARAELDHLETELARLEQTLQRGERQPVLRLERWDADAQGDQAHAEA